MDNAPKTRAKPGRLWRIVLVCSLALNLAVAGLVIGSLAAGRLGDGPPRSFDLGIGPVARALTQQERRHIGHSLRQDRVLRGFDLHGRVSNMVVALKAEPFDPDLLRSLLADQNARTAEVQSKAQAAFLDVILGMAPDRRRAFADQLADELSKARPRP